MIAPSMRSVALPCLTTVASTLLRRAFCFSSKREREVSSDGLQQIHGSYLVHLSAFWTRSVLASAEPLVGGLILCQVHGFGVHLPFSKRHVFHTRSSRQRALPHKSETAVEDWGLRFRKVQGNMGARCRWSRSRRELYLTEPDSSTKTKVRT